LEIKILSVRLYNGLTEKALFFLYDENTSFTEDEGFPMRLVLQIGLLALLYLLGSALASYFHLPLPGSILGMLLLFFALLLGVCRMSWIEEGAVLHLKHITLLFIPPIINVVQYTGIFRKEGAKLLIVLGISSFIVLLVTAYAAEWYEKIKRRHSNGDMDG
jgi:holin-like protein